VALLSYTFNNESKILRALVCSLETNKKTQYVSENDL
jgi:hypothetical protein